MLVWVCGRTIEEGELGGGGGGGPGVEVPVFVRDGEGERHIGSGVEGNVQLQIEGIVKCPEGCGRKLGSVRLFVNRGKESRPEPDRSCAEAEQARTKRRESRKGPRCK